MLLCNTRDETALQVASSPNYCTGQNFGIKALSGNIESPKREWINIIFFKVLPYCVSLLVVMRTGQVPFLGGTDRTANIC